MAISRTPISARAISGKGPNPVAENRFRAENRVKETTTTTGTGAFALADAMTAFRTFYSTVGHGNRFYYTVQAVSTANVPSGAWEVGVGQYDAYANAITRVKVLASSNAGALVNFAAGTKEIWLDWPARAQKFRGAKALLSANLTYTTANAAITWDSVEYDTDGFWSSGAPTQLVIPEGVHKIRAFMVCLDDSTATATGYFPSIRINGAVVYSGPHAVNNWPSGGQRTVGAVTPDLPVNEGDVITGHFNRTGTLTLIQATSFLEVQVVES